ncbi:MAG: viroplasmin family protein, partial [Culicoidibacterales bacterium]
MAKKKSFYAVKKGIVPGIYKTWEECKLSVHGFSGAEYTAFSTEEEALSYLSGNNLHSQQKPKMSNADIITQVNDEISNEIIVAFVDGSYNANTKKYGYGSYIQYIENNTFKSKEIYGNGNYKKHVEAENVAGELYAVIHTIEYIIKEELTDRKIKIYHDLEGAQKWATKEWKAKEDVTKFYIQKLDEYKEFTQIDFQWIKGHSKIEYNDIADDLAKLGASGKSKKVGRGYAMFDCVKIEELKSIIEKISSGDGVNTESKKITRGECFILSNEKNEKLRITYYKKAKKVLLQGKMSTLFQGFVSIYSENLEDFDLISAYNKMYKSNVKTTDIAQMYQKQFEKFPDNYPTDIQSQIKQALINSNKAYIYNTMETEVDYSYLIIP